MKTKEQKATQDLPGWYGSFNFPLPSASIVTDAQKKRELEAGITIPCPRLGIITAEDVKRECVRLGVFPVAWSQASTEVL